MRWPTSACTITRPEAIAGKYSRKCSSTGTEMLYGRLATRPVGVPGSSVIVMASAVTTVSGASGRKSSTVTGSCAASRLSISTATTDAPASSSPSVSDPSPGPISTTVSPSVTPAALTMRRTVFASMTKFWPSFFVGWMPSSSARSRISAGPRSLDASAIRRSPDAPSARQAPHKRRARSFAPLRSAHARSDESTAWS